MPNGTYNAELWFAEIYPYAYPGARVLDIKIENVVVGTTLDMVGTVGPNNADNVTVPGVLVSHGVLEIDLVPEAGSPKISAVAVIQP